MTTHAAQVSAALDVLRAVADAIRMLGRVPSGELYAHLCGQLTLEQYTQVISILKGSGVIREDAHVLIWQADD